MREIENIVLVTGAGGGIGAAICETLAGPGTAILACEREGGPDLGPVLDAVRRKGGKAETAFGDLADPEVPRRLVDAAISHFGGLSACISNAGVPGAGWLDEVTLEEWDRIMAINLRAGWLLARAAFPYLRKSKGCYIGIGSVSGMGPQHGMGLYNIAKCATIMLCQTLAQEWGQFGVRSNSVSPGFVRSPLTEATYADPQKLAARTALVPYSRIGSPQDIANGVAWLAGEGADYVTGHNLVIDGGFSGTGNRQITPIARKTA